MCRKTKIHGCVHGLCIAGLFQLLSWYKVPFDAFAQAKTPPRVQPSQGLGNHHLLRSLEKTASPPEVLKLVHDELDGTNRHFAVACFRRLGHLSTHFTDDVVDKDMFQKLLEILTTTVSNSHFDTSSLSTIMLSAAHLRNKHKDLSLLLSYCASALRPMARTAPVHHLVNGIWALARSRHQSGPVFHSLWQEAIERLERFSLVDIHKFAWAAASMEIRDEDLWRKLAQAAVYNRNQMSPISITELAWSFGTIQIYNAEAVRVLTAEANLKIASFGLPDLSIFAWALAKMAVVDTNIWRTIAPEACSKIQLSKPQELSNLLWAYGKCLAFHSELCNVITKEAHLKMNRFKPQELSNICWSLARLTQQNEPLMDSIALAIVNKRRGLVAQNIANIAWAFAQLAYKNDDVFKVLCDEGASKAASFSPQGLSNLVWSFASVQHDSQQFFPVLLLQIKEKVAVFKAQELTNLVWALAKLGVYDTPVLSAIAEHAMQKANAFNAQELANLAWATATLTFSHVELQSKVISEANEKAEGFKPQELCNILWAWATIGIDDFKVPQLLAEKALRQLPQFEPQELANLAWSFTMLRIPKAKGLEAVGLAFQEKMVGFEPSESSAAVASNFAMSISALLWCLNFSEILSTNFAVLARAKLMQIGRCMDGTRDHWKTQILMQSKSAPSYTDEPSIILNLPDRLVLWKPPGWEVQRDHDQGETLWKQLSSYLQGLLPSRQWPLIFDPKHCYGLIHRLDVPSSGLIVAAKTYEAYYDLDMQKNIGLIDRDYVALCHGLIDPTITEITGAIRSTTNASVPGWIDNPGKPSMTRLKVLAHAERRQTMFTLLSLRIATGRRHQIRIHCAHIGHPTVCDPKYTPREVFQSDKLWCKRNFLHRFRLAFQDLKGIVQDVMAPLPQDLVSALSHVSPQDAESAAALACWMSGSATQPWDMHARLGSHHRQVG